jgi:hypothetical protein
MAGYSLTSCCAIGPPGAAPMTPTTTSGKRCPSPSTGLACRPGRLGPACLGGLFDADQCAPVARPASRTAGCSPRHLPTRLLPRAYRPDPGQLPRHGAGGAGQRLREPAGAGARHPQSGATRPALAFLAFVGDDDTDASSPGCSRQAPRATPASSPAATTPPTAWCRSSSSRRWSRSSPKTLRAHPERPVDALASAH